MDQEFKAFLDKNTSMIKLSRNSEGQEILPPKYMIIHEYAWKRDFENLHLADMIKARDILQVHPMETFGWYMLKEEFDHDKELSNINNPKK